ncbi:hypothetical protein [Streptomyces sp. UH6]|uniref:hypothetical protein n=1 Tax=Streptomyces sp. UH6 TaxID=2748379 RepID=UPI0015D5231B|nr:hypothetical protein [Streptomyces sp. UH6]NYV76550.1 hypothetical protein [Streptomyces sp. UH6]
MSHEPRQAAERPARVVVTGPPRRHHGHGRGGGTHYRPRTEIHEQTTLGHTYVRSLMRTQLRTALTVFAVLAALVAPLPLLFAAAPHGRLLEWAVLGFCLYPPLVLLARWHVRRAERHERDFVRLVEDQDR